jgi:hypothetical protein
MIGRKSVIASAVALPLLATPPAWACQNAANLITNCGFETSTGAWAVFGGEGTLSFQPGDGSQPPAGGTGPGSAEVTATAIAPGMFAATVAQCIANPPAGNYGWGVDSRLVSGTVSQCSVAVINSTDATCTAIVFPGFQGNMNTALSGWAQSSPGTMNVNPVHHSVFWQVRCTSSSSFVFRFDDAFFGMGLVPVELTHVSVE